MKSTLLLLLIAFSPMLYTACGSESKTFSDYYDDDDVGDDDDIDESTADIRVMSFNVRLSTGNDGSNSWSNRSKAVPVMIDDTQPTVFGVQEARLDQMQFLTAECTDYQSVGVGRDDGLVGGEFMSIFYKTADITLEDWGTFWLSETPDVPSKGWDAAINRTTTWAILKHKATGTRFLMMNTHLDHIGTVARAESMKLIDAKIKALNVDNLPVFLTGDFNEKTESSVFDVIETHMLHARLKSPETDTKASFNNFGSSTNYPHIDHIFTSNVELMCFKTIDDRYEGVPYISDHYPIMVYANFIK